MSYLSLAAALAYRALSHEEMKENALQKGLPVPDEAAIRERVLRKDVEAPELATLKDFFRF
jgi:hypothetical protein